MDERESQEYEYDASSEGDEEEATEKMVTSAPLYGEMSGEDGGSEEMYDEFLRQASTEMEDMEEDEEEEDEEERLSVPDWNFDDYDDYQDDEDGNNKLAKSGSVHSLSVRELQSFLVPAAPVRCDFATVEGAFEESCKFVNKKKDRVVISRIEVEIEEGTKGLFKPDLPEEERWVCKGIREKKEFPQPPGKDAKPPTVGANVLERMRDICIKNLQNFLQKWESGLIELPKSREQKCHPGFQHGIDPTPTPSTCGKNKGKDKDAGLGRDTTISFREEKEDSLFVAFEAHFLRKSQIEPTRSIAKLSQKMLDIKEYLQESSALIARQHKDEFGEDADEDAFCPILEETVAEYLQFEVFEKLLKSAGAMDEEGKILCSLENFYAVEHMVKALLVERAQQCMTTFKIRLRDAQKRKEYEERKPIEMESLAAKDLKRKHLQNVLSGKPPSGESEEKEKRKSSLPKRKTTIYRGSVPIPEPVDPHKRKSSLDKEKFAEEIADRIVRSMMDIGKEVGAGDGDKVDGEIVEIMPYEYHKSFDEERQEGAVPLAAPTEEEEEEAEEEADPDDEEEDEDEAEAESFRPADRKTLPEDAKDYFHLEGPVAAQYKSWRVPKVPCCGSGLDGLARPRTFAEWELRRKNEDHSGDHSRKHAKKHGLRFKYFYKWLERVRRIKAIKEYPAEDSGRFGLWKGPFPELVVRYINTLPDAKDRDPATEKDFYKSVRKLEALMFEESRQILKNEMEGYVPDCCGQSGQGQKSRGQSQADDSLSSQMELVDVAVQAKIRVSGSGEEEEETEETDELTLVTAIEGLEKLHMIPHHPHPTAPEMEAETEAEEGRGSGEAEDADGDQEDQDDNENEVRDSLVDDQEEPDDDDENEGEEKPRESEEIEVEVLHQAKTSRDDDDENQDQDGPRGSGEVPEEGRDSVAVEEEGGNGEREGSVAEAD